MKNGSLFDYIQNSDYYRCSIFETVPLNGYLLWKFPSVINSPIAKVKLNSKFD